jgi:hypothetical protein
MFFVNPSHFFNASEMITTLSLLWQFALRQVGISQFSNPVRLAYQ